MLKNAEGEVQGSGKQRTIIILHILTIHHFQSTCKRMTRCYSETVRGNQQTRSYACTAAQQSCHAPWARFDILLSRLGWLPTSWGLSAVMFIIMSLSQTCVYQDDQWHFIFPDIGVVRRWLSFQAGRWWWCANAARLTKGRAILQDCTAKILSTWKKILSQLCLKIIKHTQIILYLGLCCCCCRGYT